jgi:hypothetical protein
VVVATGRVVDGGCGDVARSTDLDGCLSLLS